MINGRAQVTWTIITSVFVAGTIWARISHNAALMRETMDRILAGQQEIKHQLDTLILKRP